MSDAATYRLVAIVACWSWDQWVDLPESEHRRPVPRSVPDTWSILLSAEYDCLPNPAEVAKALSITNLIASGYYGFAVLRYHSLMTRRTWSRFAQIRGPDFPDELRRTAGSVSPPIAIFSRAKHARWAIGRVLPIPRPLPSVPIDWREAARR